jgi:hypothetical protein
VRVSSHATLSAFAPLKRTIIVYGRRPGGFDRRRRIRVARRDVFDEKPAALVLNDTPQLALRFDIAANVTFAADKAQRLGAKDA